MNKEKTYLDEGENGVYLEQADEDGIQLCENSGDGKVYVYFSEIPKLISILQEYKQ